ncbi:MAG: HD-GYP domain-containing protein [Clostridium sp.]
MLNERYSIGASEFLGEVISIVNKVLFEEKSAPYYSHINTLATKLRLYYTHAINVAVMSGVIARYVGYDEDKVKEIIIGALLHDVGKVTIDKNILSKSYEERNEVEVRILERHPKFGRLLLANSKVPEVSLEIVLKHHENFDGTGFPSGLKEEEIGEEVKIVTIAGWFDALTSPELNCNYEIKCSENMDDVIKTLEDMSDKISKKYVDVLKTILNI